MVIFTAPLVAAGIAALQPEGTRLAGQVDLARWADLLADRLKITLVYDPTMLTGTVAVRGTETLPDEQLWAVFNHVLFTRGLATVSGPAPRSFVLVRLSETGPGPAAPPGESGKLAPGLASVVYTPRFRTAKELSEAVGKLVSKSGSVTTAGELAILVTDATPRLRDIERWLASLDTPRTEVSVETIPARNLPAGALALSMQQVSNKRDAVMGQKAAGEVVPQPVGDAVLVIAPDSALPYWRALAATLDVHEPVETRTYSPKFFAVRDVAKLVEDSVRAPADDRWRLVVDELTGSLIVTGSAQQHEQLRLLLERLDAAPAAARRPVRMYPVKNRAVTEMKALLDELLAAGVLAIPDSGTEGATDGVKAPGGPMTSPNSPSEVDAIHLPLPPRETAAALPTPPSQTVHQPSSASLHAEPDLAVTITADEGTSTLIATGDPRLLDQIETILKTLDVRQPQVMLEVMIVSLTERQTLDLGVELEQILISNDVRVRLASLFGLGTRALPAAPAGSGFTGVVLSPGDFSILIRALQTINNGRAMSMPKLLVANNQEATLDSVLEQPFASLNATNTVSTNSYGGSKPAGTQVTLKPQIAEGDSLILTYSVALSAFTGAASSPALPPPRQENKVKSVATIPDGYTVAVGGIELSSEGKSVEQVPLIGSIPVLGEAFKNRSKNSSRTRFYVFIRAGIMRDRGFEDLKYISDQDVARAGVEDGWPQVEPLVIR